jgi:hypothetical protein
MGKKTKTKSSPEPKMTKQEQYERFKETARKLDADTNEEKFERAFKKIVPPKRRP